MEVVARLALAAVLVFASGSKLAAPRSSQSALATFGLRTGSARWVAWALIVVAELVLATGVAAGSDLAAWGAAALLTIFAVVLEDAMRRGRTGAPCACFGSRSTVRRVGVLQNLALAAAFAALPWLPAASLDREGWLVLGLGIALAGVAVLAVAVMALAREVGLLRLQLAPQGALEIASEGPPVGDPSALAERFELPPQARLAVAVFSSPGCRLCQSLDPAIATLRSDPFLAVEVFDEERHAEVWRELGVPGSPFAIDLDTDGVVRAKGTFSLTAGGRGQR